MHDAKDQTSLANGTGSGLLSTHSSGNDAFRSNVIMDGRVGCSGLGRLGADVVAPRLMSARPVMDESTQPGLRDQMCGSSGA
jgi:hypothetical protein